MLYARMHVDANPAAIVAAQWEHRDVMTVVARIVSVASTLSVAEPCGTPHARRKQSLIAKAIVIARMASVTALEIVAARMEHLDVIQEIVSSVSVITILSVAKKSGMQIA